MSPSGEKVANLVRQHVGVHALSTTNPYTAMGQLIETIKALLESLVSSAIDQIPPRDEVITYAGEVFDTLIAPIDIPYIGPVIEQRVDAALRNILLTQVGNLYDKITRKAFASGS